MLEAIKLVGNDGSHDLGKLSRGHSHLHTEIL
jgi:hypothetical protein